MAQQTGGKVDDRDEARVGIEDGHDLDHHISLA
jgi:hypothetical protein